jgi:hypothetical protein
MLSRGKDCYEALMSSVSCTPHCVRSRRGHTTEISDSLSHSSSQIKDEDALKRDFHLSQRFSILPTLRLSDYFVKKPQSHLTSIEGPLFPRNVLFTQLRGGGVIPSTQCYYRRGFYYLLLLKLLHVSVVRPSSGRNIFARICSTDKDPLFLEY